VYVRSCSGAPSGSIGYISTPIAPNTIFSVSVTPGATGYAWSQPSGLTIISGGTSSTVYYRTASYGTTIYGNSIYCTLSNECGSSTAYYSPTITVANPVTNYGGYDYAVKRWTATYPNTPPNVSGWTRVEFADLNLATRQWLVQNRNAISNIDNLSSTTTLATSYTYLCGVARTSGPWYASSEWASGATGDWGWPAASMDANGTVYYGEYTVTGYTSVVLYRR
jgi:hypothetical protein